MGLEKPIEYGRQQIFDPTTAKMLLDAQDMYVNAVYNDYLRGLEEMKEFKKEYGDFITPILADQDWYNKNVTGKVRDFINNAYAQGIDLTRSAEGRAAVSQLINSINVGDIAKLRSSAENAKEYIKNRGILEASGKWDPEFEKFANYGQTLEGWDTIGNGIWNRTSPAEVKTLKELTESWYNNRTAHMLDKAGVESFGMQYDPRYDYMGFTSKDLLDIASGQTPGWNGSIYSDYYRQLAKNKLQAMGVENPSAQQVEQQLQRDIATANTEYLINPQRSVNQLYLQGLKNQIAREVAGIRAAGKDRTGNNGTIEPGAPTTFMDRLQRNMDLNFEQKRFGRENVGNTLNGIVQYWDKMAKSYEANGKIVGREKYKEDVPTQQGAFVPGMTTPTRSTTGIKQVEKERNVYNQKNNASYNKAIYERDRWSNFAHGNYYPSRYDTRKTEDGKYVVHVIRDILKKGKDATPVELSILQRYQEEDVQRMMMKSQSSSPEWSSIGGKRGQMSVSDAKKKASDFWDTFAAEGLGSTQNKVLHQTFVGASDTQKDPDLPNGYYSVRFGSGYHYAPIRQLGISGNAKFKHNDIHNKFDRFLNGQKGISIDTNDVRAAGIPHADRMGKQLDILSHPLISKEQLQQFFNSLSDGDKQKYKDINGVAKQLGLHAIDQTITYRDKNEELHSSDTYYEVPVIRTIENLGGYNFRDINVLSDNIEFNASTADKNVINSENQSVMEDLPIELAIQLLQ